MLFHPHSNGGSQIITNSFDLITTEVDIVVNEDVVDVAESVTDDIVSQVASGVELS